MTAILFGFELKGRKKHLKNEKTTILFTAILVNDNIQPKRFQKYGERKIYL
ncbi:hypothetical protein GCM10028861_19850 [Flavobacterium koreense]